MNTTKRLASEMDAIENNFLEKSYKIFDSYFSDREQTFINDYPLTIIDEGIITVKSFCYLLWLVDFWALEYVKSITNHEGMWTFVFYSDIPKEYLQELKGDIERVFSFQDVDNFSDCEFTVEEK